MINLPITMAGIFLIIVIPVPIKMTMLATKIILLFPNLARGPQVKAATQEPAAHIVVIKAELELLASESQPKISPKSFWN